MHIILWTAQVLTAEETQIYITPPKPTREQNGNGKMFDMYIYFMYILNAVLNDKLQNMLKTRHFKCAIR